MLENHEASTAETADPVFTDEKAEAAAANDPLPEAKTKKRKLASATDPANPTGRLFAPTEEEKQAEARRVHDKRIGVIIGAKGLASLRTFGYDVVHVQDAPLSSGVAHRGLD